MTRERWREVWRWKRVMKKALAEHEDRMVEVWRQMNTQAALHGTVGLRVTAVKDRIAYEIINPPLMFGPLK